MPTLLFATAAISTTISTAIAAAIAAVIAAAPAAAFWWINVCGNPHPPFPCLSRHSTTSSSHHGCWRWTMPTPNEPMPGSHRIVDALPHWRPSPLAAMARSLRRRRPSTAQCLPRHHPCPTSPLLPSLRRHRRHHRHLRPPPTAAALEQDNRARVAYVLTPSPPLYLSPPLLLPRG